MLQSMCQVSAQWFEENGPPTQCLKERDGSRGKVFAAQA